MMPERARESLARKPESSGVADELSAAPPTNERVSSGGSSLVPRASHSSSQSHKFQWSNRRIENNTLVLVTLVTTT